MKNPFLSSQTLLQKMGRTRSKTPPKEIKPAQSNPNPIPTKLPQQPPSYSHKYKQPSPFSSNPYTPPLKQQFTLPQSKQSYQSVETTKITDNQPFSRHLPNLKIQQHNFQSSDGFNQQKSTTSHKFQDISLNIQLSPIHSKRNQDMSILPLSDSLLMQCLAKTETRDELAKILGIEEKKAEIGFNNRENFFRSERYQQTSPQFNFELNSNLPSRPRALSPFQKKQQPMYSTTTKPYNNQQQDQFNFEQFKSENQIQIDSIIQNKHIPRVMKYEPVEIVQKLVSQQLYDTLPRFNQEIKLNFKANLIDKINKQMEPLYQKDNIKIFLTANDKITVKKFQLSQ